MSPRALTVASAACLFLVIVTAKWATFNRFGSPMPDWDQWDAEAGELLTPWFTGDNFVSHLLHPHNEHRVVLTKLQNLALVLLNGQWDSRLEAVTNAMLHAAVATGLWLLARRWLAGAWQVAVFILLAVLFGLPVAWQNVLGGFHSQQYWLLGLSFLALLWLPFAGTWSVRWWLGTLAALLVLGSMGSGLLAAAVVLIWIGWRTIRRELPLREVWPTVVLCLAVIAAGWLTRVEVKWHQHMKATAAHDFIVSMVHSLQWPCRDQHWAAGLLWLPWLLVAARVLAAPPTPAAPAAPRTTSGGPGPVLVVLGGWVLAQVAATAWARGAGADYPASRYMDTLSCGAAINALALGWLLTHALARRVLRQGLWILGLAWLATLGAGLYHLLDGVLGVELPDAKKYYIKAEGHMRRYLATLDPKMLAYPDIPYPSAQGIIDRLVDPHLRSLMPVPLRPPLPLTPAGAAAGFSANDARRAAPDALPRLGLSPATPPLDFAPTWGSHPNGAMPGPVAAWRSQPLPPPRHRGWLQFETAGHLGRPGLSLEIRAAADDALLASIRPSRTPEDTWRSAQVRAPRVPYVVVARDAEPQLWLAFSGPVEMGPLSYWAWQVTKHGLVLLGCSLAATLLVACAAAGFSRRPAPAGRT